MKTPRYKNRSPYTPLILPAQFSGPAGTKGLRLQRSLVITLPLLLHLVKCPPSLFVNRSAPILDRLNPPLL
eukprot:6007382-Amphidinium_carterae.1